MFWEASISELKRGYIQEENYYTCILCGKKFEKGIVYPVGETFYEAERYVRIHIENVHESVFEYLINMDKKLTGLTEHQNRLLRLFYQGKSDKEVQEEMGIGSTSTIRNHRFALKEKERQAKMFLVLMELLEEKDKFAPTFVKPHKTAKMIDNRYNITQKENEKLLKKYFPEGIKGPLSTFPLKEKHRLIIIREIAKRFERDHSYNEKEINEILKSANDDYVTLRRYLVEYGFLDRKHDGSQYWLKE